MNSTETNLPKIDVPSAQKPSGVSDARPRAVIIIVAVYALLQIVRIFAFPLVQDALAGRQSVAWLYPAFVDIFIGITAPFVAFGIWQRKGLAVWVGAIVWFTLSIFDHLDAVTVALHVTGPLPNGFPPSQSGAVTFLLVASALEALALVWLTRRKTRSYYLASSTRSN